MKCTKCGRNETLVYSSIINGNLCRQCYDICIEKARNGSLWKDDASGMLRREAEIRALDKIKDAGLQDAFNNAITMIRMALSTEPYPEIKLGKKIEITYTCGLNKSITVKIAVCTPECGYETPFIRVEKMANSKVSKSNYIVRDYFYANGKHIRKKFK